MAREISNVDDVVQLLFDFGRHGWCDLHVIVEGRVTTYRISGVYSNAPEALIELCHAVLENSSHRVALCDEPGGVIFEISSNPTQKHTTTLSIYDAGNKIAFDNTATGELLLNFTIKRRRLLGMLITELWKIHQFLKEPSYQRGRADFPHRKLLDLNRSWDESQIGPSFLK